MSQQLSDQYSVQSARAIAAPVGAVGGAFMLHPEVLGPGKEAGYGGFAYYVVGRGGVLGDVDAKVVSSAFGFFAPGLIAKLWNDGVKVEGARAGADRYAAACADFGRRRLSGFSGSARLAELVDRITSAADNSALALFAGWQAQPLPDDADGRCYQLLHVLRELRGSAHIVAVVASGLTPLEAVIANPANSSPENGSAAQAERFGWSGPFPDAASLADQFARAESLTDEIMGRFISVLSNDEQAELVRLVTEAHTLISH